MRILFGMLVVLIIGFTACDLLKKDSWYSYETEIPGTGCVDYDTEHHVCKDKGYDSYSEIIRSQEVVENSINITNNITYVYNYNCSPCGGCDSCDKTCTTFNPEFHKKIVMDSPYDCKCGGWLDTVSYVFTFQYYVTNHDLTVTGKWLRVKGTDGYVYGMVPSTEELVKLGKVGEWIKVSNDQYGFNLALTNGSIVSVELKYRFMNGKIVTKKIK